MITQPQVLAPDVIIAPVAALARTVRRRLRAAGDSYAISRPGGRRPSKIIDHDSARLLELFRSPRRIVDAVVEYSRNGAADPRATLAAAFPMLNACREAGFLVAAGSADARRILPMLQRGDATGAWRVLRCVQVLEDVELYQAGHADDVVALKVLRPGAGDDPRSALANEARILRHLRGRGSPRLKGEIQVDGRPALVMSWCEGVSPVLVAAELRQQQDRRGLLRLTAAIAAAYATLHARGVTHGDVDPRNLMVDAGGAVTILDFGLARLSTDRTAQPRPGLTPLLEPEYARAELAGRPLPPLTAAAEQYAVAAVLYLLMTGDLYLDLSLQAEQALRQIVTEPPLAFVRRGAARWPGVERILARALRKQPAARYPSMRALTTALRIELARLPRRPARPALPGTVAPLDRVAARLLTELDVAGAAFGKPLEAPSASVKFGAAGIALALYRVACLRDDARLLSWADAWLGRAERDVAEKNSGAFYDDPGVSRRMVGTVTPWHTASGVHLVRAQVSQAAGDLPSLGAAVHGYVATSRARCPNVDLTLGRSGTLLGAANLLDVLPPGTGKTSQPLRELGTRRLREIWRAMDALPPVARSTPFPAFGVAHGWAGVSYATLRWCASSGDESPHGLERRLDELAACAEPAGRGIRWPSEHFDHEGRPVSGYVSGWCNGSAGIVHLWTLAHCATGRDRYLDLAVRAAWHTWEDADNSASLCCGLAGRCYALLNVYRYTADVVWLKRARALADRAARHIAARRRPERLARSLYKGDTALVILAADLDRPEAARMPMFEEEGWPKPRKM